MMIFNKKQFEKLYDEWTASRYFPETSFFEFLRSRGIRLVDSEKIKQKITEFTDTYAIHSAKAGVKFYDILQDIIEGKEE